MDKRNDVRIPLIACGKVATLCSTESGSVYTANVSRQGICFYSKASLPLEADVVLEIELGPSPKTMVKEHIHGRVLWKREWSDITAHGIYLSSPLTLEKTPCLSRLVAGSQSCPQAHPSQKSGRPRPRILLTERERDITRLIAKGYNNKQVARRLSISRKTVETHRANIYSKLKVHNAVQLIRALEKSGLWLVNPDQRGP